MVPMGLEIVFWTVRRVRRAVVGTVRRVSPAWFYVRMRTIEIATSRIERGHWTLSRK
jgi:hypothetical protein